MRKVAIILALSKALPPKEGRSGVTISSAFFTRAWIGALVYLVALSLVGAFAIPAGQDLVIRWSWGDWTPVGYASKAWGLSIVPSAAALVALASIARRRATGLEFIPAPFAWAEIFAMSVIIAVHSIIVLVAILLPGRSYHQTLRGRSSCGLGRCTVSTRTDTKRRCTNLAGTTSV